MLSDATQMVRVQYLRRPPVRSASTVQYSVNSANGASRSPSSAKGPCCLRARRRGKGERREQEPRLRAHCGIHRQRWRRKRRGQRRQRRRRECEGGELRGGGSSCDCRVASSDIYVSSRWVGASWCACCDAASDTCVASRMGIADWCACCDAPSGMYAAARGYRASGRAETIKGILVRARASVRSGGMASAMELAMCKDLAGATALVDTAAERSASLPAVVSA